MKLAKSIVIELKRGRALYISLINQNTSYIQKLIWNVSDDTQLSLMGKFETNQVDVNGDGRVILYQRPDVKNPKWQCRISVSGATGYKVFSCKNN